MIDPTRGQASRVLKIKKVLSNFSFFTRCLTLLHYQKQCRGYPNPSSKYSINYIYDCRFCEKEIYTGKKVKKCVLDFSGQGSPYRR